MTENKVKRNPKWLQTKMDLSEWFLDAADNASDNFRDAVLKCAGEAVGLCLNDEDGDKCSISITTEGIRFYMDLGGDADNFPSFEITIEELVEFEVDMAPEEWERFVPYKEMLQRGIDILDSTMEKWKKVYPPGCDDGDDEFTPGYERGDIEGKGSK